MNAPLQLVHWNAIRCRFLFYIKRILHCNHFNAPHTHPFNGPFSGTTWVSRYQKGKTNLDFTEARDSGISWAICKSAPCSRQKTTPASHHSVFYRPDALPAAQPTASKHWRQISMHHYNINEWGTNNTATKQSVDSVQLQHINGVSCPLGLHIRQQHRD